MVASDLTVEKFIRQDKIFVLETYVSLMKIDYFMYCLKLNYTPTPTPPIF